MSDTVIAVITEIARVQRLRATAKEQLARVVMACPEFDDVKFTDIEPEIKTKGKRFIYTFGGIVDRGEHYDSVGFTVRLVRRANGEVVATATDDQSIGGMPNHFGPGTLAEVVDMIGFEHARDSSDIAWVG